MQGLQECPVRLPLVDRGEDDPVNPVIRKSCQLLALRPECILSWDYLQKVDAILKEGKRTAFVCTADEYALEIMKDQKRAKRKAPVDYGITGFDNIDTLAYVTPQLSTISNVVDEVAKSAVEMLFAMIDADPEVEQMTGDSQRILSHRYLEGETL